MQPKNTRLYPWQGPRLLLCGLALALAALAGCEDEDENLPFTVTRTPTEVVEGPIPIFFDLTAPSGTLINTVVEYSGDGGRTFLPATPAPGAPDTSVLLASADGAEHFFFWDPLADLGPGLHRSVQVRVFGLGDGSVPGDTARFFVDLSDRLDPASGNAPGLSEAVAVPLYDGRVWVSAGRNPVGGLNSAGYLYDPRTDATTSAPALGVARAGAAGVLLRGGAALIIGGDDGSGTSDEGDLLQVAPAGTTVTRLPGALGVPRRNPVAAALPDGRAVILGGEAAGGLTDAVEVFSPTTGTSTIALNSPTCARAGARATPLLDGRVLLSGGVDPAGQAIVPTALVEASVAAVTSGGALSQARAEHGALLLPDGRVFLAGGTSSLGDDASALSSVEVYDPRTQSVSLLPGMLRRRRNPALAYTDGAVVVFGGSGDVDAATTVERYEFTSNDWTFIAGPSGTSRAEAVALTVGPGFVLVAGGGEPPERYYPDADLLADTGDVVRDVPEARADHTATILFDGRVLVAGGTAFVSSALSSVEIFARNDDEFTDAAPLLRARTEHAATLTARDEVLVVGGRNAQGFVAPVELYEPNTDTWRDAGTLNVPRVDCTVTRTANGLILVAGGVDANGLPVGEVEVWDPDTEVFTVDHVLSDPRANHTALEHTERVLIGPGTGLSGELASVEVIDRFRDEQFLLPGDFARSGAALDATELTLVISGGSGPGGVRGDIAFVDLSGPNPVFLSETRPLAVPRSGHTLDLRIRESMVVVGGRGDDGAVHDRVEVFTFGTQRPQFGISELAADPYLNKARWRHTATALHDGRILVVGGLDERGLPIPGAETFQ